MATDQHFDQPADAIRALAAHLQSVGIETSHQPTGRILAQEVHADRDSPAADVSAMDGYAIRLADLSKDQVTISGESIPGSPPPQTVEGQAVRIFTGAVIPSGCEAVIKREETIEEPGSIRWRPEAKRAAAGMHIRRAGENVRAGQTVLPPGGLLNSPRCAALRNFSDSSVDVYRPVRVTILTTGDELYEPTAGAAPSVGPAPEKWQIRNSNRVALAALLSGRAWLETPRLLHAPDDRPELGRLLGEALESSDAVLITGGVSMGDYDFVPGVVEDLGARTIFHRLAIRPGKPILGAATDDGKLILGLPGNPVSATIGCRRFGFPLLAKISGQIDWLPPCPSVSIQNAGAKTLPLHWMRAVSLNANGLADMTESKGSGDLVALAQSSGFVELPPHAAGPGPWPYYAW